MRHLELHIIQSVPVACLNRDDFGSPKTAVFGNVQRARVSSQCWKRAARELMQEYDADIFHGQRTRLLLDPLRELLENEHKLSAKEANEGAEAIGEALAKVDRPSADKDTPAVRVKTLFFTSPLELETLASAYAGAKDESATAKRAAKAVKQIGKVMKDAADIALFGRMVASDHSLTLEGAAMFGHALSTHKVSNEIDFFAAVDDRQPEDKSGAGMTGTLEYNSATYYRFAALNLDMLADAKHLGQLTAEERQHVVRLFVEATVRSVPSARHNSMFAATMPSYVLAVVREQGHPVQLVNAFEEPVWSRGGLVKVSREKLDAEYAALKQTWGLEAALECRIPDMSLETMLNEVARYVR